MNKLIIFTLFLFANTFAVANPYIDFKIDSSKEELAIQYETTDGFYLKDIEIESKDGLIGFSKGSNEIILENTQKINILKFSYAGCITESICQEKESIILERINNEWEISENDIEFESSKNNIEITESIPNEKITFSDYINDPNLILEHLKENGFMINILVFFLIGLLLSFTPCIFPMLPIVSSIVIKNNRKNPFMLSSSYALGIASSYALIGLIMGTLNLNLQIYFQNVYVILGMALLFFVLGFLMISNYTFSFFNKSNNFLNNKAQSINSSGYFSTFSIGLVSSLVISPCAAAPIIGILIYMQTEQHSLIQQMSILFSLGLGAGVPLVLISSSFKKFLPNNGEWMNKVKNFFSAVLFAVGVYTLQKITFLDLNGLYIVIALIYFSDFIKKHHALYLSISLLIIFSYSLFLNQSPDEISDNKIDYIKIENIEQLNNQLDVAKNNEKPVFIDIYADWCTTCIKMEKETLNSKEIIDFVNRDFIPLKIDITDIDNNKQEILKQYKLQTAPAYIFYNSDGEMEKKYYIGFLSEEEFLNILKKQI
jgi:thiol:disulfide interchange protein DsbD